mmetsp:Transcript_46541/g.110884  ORF Transcript_46541/g.110884 Transcript_46541/m.110884 type:complete len:226 (-) Transcript_46541:159-836(-)
MCCAPSTPATAGPFKNSGSSNGICELSHSRRISSTLPLCSWIVSNQLAASDPPRDGTGPLRDGTGPPPDAALATGPPPDGSGPLRDGAPDAAPGRGALGGARAGEEAAPGRSTWTKSEVSFCCFAPHCVQNCAPWSSVTRHLTHAGASPGLGSPHSMQNRPICASTLLHRPHLSPAPAPAPALARASAASAARVPGDTGALAPAAPASWEADAAADASKVAFTAR